MTRGDELRKEILGIFESLRYKRDLWSVYSDFLEMTAIAISNSTERVAVPGRYDKREQRYLSLAKTYKRDELMKFSEVFALFVKLQDYNIQSQGAKDILGGLLMELGLGDKWGGQFFTPDHVANLMDKMAYTEEDFKKDISKRGFVYASDPAVGGGVTMIGLVNAMLDGGCNPQKELFVECGDLDKRACFMTYIQLATLGIPAIVKNQDAITGETFDVWLTPAFYMGAWWLKIKGFKDGKKGESIAKSKEILKKREEILDKKTEKLEEEKETFFEEDGQMSLF